MKKHLLRHLLGLGVLLVLLGHAAGFYQIGILGHFDAILYDTRLRLAMPRTVDERVVILDIDEKSLAEVGRWPWSRDRMSVLVDKLFDRYGIAILGFDVVFAEPDHSSGLQTLETLAKAEFKDSTSFQSSLKDLRPKLDYDARFAAALKDRRVILGYYLSNLVGGTGTGTGALPEPVLPAGTFSNRPIAFTQWVSHGGNLPEFQKVVAGAGHFNPLVDFDGTVRRVPMIAEYNGQYYESLSLAMVRAVLGATKVVPGFPEGAGGGYAAMEWLDLPSPRGTLRVPVDANVATLVPYRGIQKSFRYIPAADILADRVGVEQLKGKIVLVGTTAPGLMDLRATPVGATYPGVEIHANLISGMLDGTLKHKPSFVLGIDVLALLTIGVALVFLLPRFTPLRATLVSGLALLAFLSANFAFWHYGQMVIPLASGIVLVTFLYALNMSWGYFVESRSKRQFTELFGQYVPPELVDEMAKNPEGYSMAGRRAELTVLFSDVRGFTTISEGLEPEQLAALMNEYLGAMTEVIRRHRGTLDKYIGDAIMAFWGAPVGDPDHAKNAVITALEMQKAMGVLNTHLAEKGWPELKIGIGVNTGNMTVGDMGSPVRKAYTVMGDAVNLGSRLEGITKQYGVGIVVGEETRDALKKEAVFRELDCVRVKGKDEPVAIYEPIGFDGDVPKERFDQIKLWNQALRSYRAQDWDQAEVMLLNLSRMEPCRLYDLYAERIAQYRKAPPPSDWGGVTTFETK